MKKIVCPHCGVVNLEKFVTFPNCAGCGARLCASRQPTCASIWRRPLRAGFWASLVGLALAGVVALSFSASEPGEPRQLIVYAQMPRHARLGEVLVCRLGIESVVEDGREAGVLHEVSWRLSQGSERDWDVISVEPSPDAPARWPGRASWSYKHWRSEERWMVRLQPRARGKRVLAINANASEHFPVQWRTTVTVR